MQTRFLTLAATLLFAATTFAQTKLDMSLNHRVSRYHVEMSRARGASAETAMVSVIAQLNEDAQLPENSLQTMGVMLGGVYGRFVSMTVPVDRLEELAAMTEFKAIEENIVRSPQNKTSQQGTHAAAVNSPDSAALVGLPQAFTGKGVAVGVVDTGIDFNNVNFIDKDTHRTRIKDAILYRKFKIVGNVLRNENGKGLPTVNDICEEYTLDANIDTLTTDNHYNGHGTHVACTAAGSYAGDYLNSEGAVYYSGLQGTAPEADLLLAGTRELQTDFLLDAFTRIQRRAEELHEPLVVNYSIGTVGDWLDGKTVESQFFDQYTDNGNRKGVIVCESAANAADANCSLYTTLDESNNHTLRTCLDPSYDSNKKSGYLADWVGIWSKDNTPFTVNLEFYEADADGNCSAVDSLTWDEEDLKRLGYYSANYYTNHDGRYAGQFYTAIGDSINIGKLWPVIVIHSESDCTVRLFSRNFSYGKYYPSNLMALQGTDCVAGNNAFTIVAEGCTNSILTVGNWRMVGSFLNYKSKTYKDWLDGDFGDIEASSSYCVADDNGFQRPDCAAPGSNVVSAWNSYDVNEWRDGKSSGIICGVAMEEYRDGHTSIIAGASGTSMACPNVVGIIALWLQANPDLTVNDVRKILHETCDNDEYTAASPARFGAGKINALSGIEYILKNMPAAVHDINAPSSSEKARYNLSGQKVRSDYRGIVVSDGKKYIER